MSAAVTLSILLVAFALIALDVFLASMRRARGVPTRTITTSIALPAGTAIQIGGRDWYVSAGCTGPGPFVVNLDPPWWKRWLKQLVETAS